MTEAALTKPTPVEKRRMKAAGAAWAAAGDRPDGRKVLWTAEMEDTLLDMRAAGRPFHEIGKKIGVAPATAAMRARRLGVF